ncbi:DUF5998 family protein [Georgenia halophila]|uniref:DUF5998 family protein n=1 Tax=Georgenia halophila TaxID=620889 RepID=A0ABP8LRK8_9MICO
MSRVPTDLAKKLRADLDHAGYYPDVVEGVINIALGDEPVTSFLVHPETTFDETEVFRHLTALVLSPTRLVVAHVDDAPGADDRQAALATTDSVALGQVRSVTLTHGVSEPTRGSGMQTQELTLAISWGTAQSVDLQPASCGDPDCEADHGYTGTLVPEGVELRVSAQAEGSGALHGALEFAHVLSTATSRGQSA